MFLRYSLPFTWDPSLGRSNPSPTFLIFFSIFLSPVTSVTTFHDTSSSLMLVKLESGGETPSSSVVIFEFLLCPSASYVLILELWQYMNVSFEIKSDLNLQNNLTASSATSPFLIVFTAILIAGHR